VTLAATANPSSVASRNATATVAGQAIAVTQAPRPAPTTAADTLSTPYRTELLIAAPGILANDTAHGGNALSAVLVEDVTHGSLLLGVNGSVHYTPHSGFVGTDSFAYRAVEALAEGNVSTVTITVSPPTEVQAPYDLHVDSVLGRTVTLRWSVLPIGPQATSFVVDGSTLGGEVLASIPTASAAPTFSFEAPTGSWSLRVRGQLGTDTSAASPGVPLHIGVPVTPSAPTGLTGLVNGDTLTLAWKNTFGGGPATGIAVDVSGDLVGTLPLGPVEQFMFAPVPRGSYTFRVRGTNAGGSSPASEPLTLAFPGACSGRPDMPVNLLAFRTGKVLSVMWDPPVTGPAPTSYLVHVTGSFQGSIATDGRSLSGAVGAGVYRISVSGTNPCGNGVATAVQTVIVP
jgi:hypothetical protein